MKWDQGRATLEQMLAKGELERVASPQPSHDRSRASGRGRPEKGGVMVVMDEARRGGTSSMVLSHSVRARVCPIST